MFVGTRLSLGGLMSEMGAKRTEVRPARYVGFRLADIQTDPRLTYDERAIADSSIIG